LRILFDNNVPVGLRRFLVKHEVRTIVEMDWPPQLENEDLLDAAEASGFDVMVTSDQNIQHQQNLTGRKLALLVLGSDIWPIVRDYGEVIAARVDAAALKIDRRQNFRRPLIKRPANRQQALNARQIRAALDRADLRNA
jgi:predicted nuclease of predicted toxin-antitoxin system